MTHLARLTDPEKMENLEEYACAIMNTCLMLMTSSKYHDQAAQLGLLSDIEMEKAKAICWQTNSLFAQLRDQLDEILSRTQMQEGDIFQALRSRYAI